MSVRQGQIQIHEMGILTLAMTLRTLIIHIDLKEKKENSVE